MKYVKYVNKDNPDDWAIFQYEDGDTHDKLVYQNKIGSFKEYFPIDFNRDKQYFYIIFLNEEEVDLLKLELL